MKKILLVLLSLMLLTACQSDSFDFDLAFSEDTEESEIRESEQTSYIYAMDTIMTITAYGENASTALADVSGAIYDLEKYVSVTDENSDVYKLNASSSAPLEVSDVTADIITQSLEVCAATYGALDITIYPIMQEWGFTNYNYKVPDYNVLKNLLRYVDYSSVEVDGNIVTLASGMQIDLGSVTKGYTGDMAAEMLANNGIECAILNLGGNVRLIGSNPEGEPWRIGVQHPTDSSEYLAVLEAADKSIITSGGYNRYFEEDGKIYWHIISPYTGYPANSGIVSATIIGDDGLLCDGLSTAVFVMGINPAFEFWRTRQDFDMIIISENNNIYITSGIADDFELLDKYDGEYKVEVVY